MDEIRPSSLFSLQTSSSRWFHAVKKKIKYKQHDYEESCGFYNNSNVFRKKDELKGVRNWFRTPFLSFLGERL